MEPSQQFERSVIDLGKRLVAKLSEKDDDDLLSKWMAHHIAELVLSAEAASGSPDASSTNQACMDAILKLWAHRNLLPSGHRPFEAAEAALNTLIKLDPNTPESFYFRVRDGRSEAGSSDEVQWLQFAEAMDQAARKLIRYCLGNAVESSQGNLDEWLETAQAIAVEPPSFDIQLVSRLTENAAESDLEKLAREKRKDAIALRDQLDALMTTLSALRTEIDKQIVDAGDQSAAP